MYESQLPNGSSTVGEIVFETDGRRQTSMFRYAVQWLENPQRFPIAPSMPLGESQFYASASRVNPRDALLGPVNDGSPDSWGRGLIRRARGGTLTELDYLLAVDDLTRQGSLRYLDEHGTPLTRSYPPVPRLSELATAQELGECRGRAAAMAAADMDQLLGSAGSLGGTRPKASVRDESGHLHIAKFTTDEDTMPIERAEVATLKLARAAGIRAASARLELSDTNRPVALIKRFDRSAAERLSYLSAQSFLRGPRLPQAHSTRTSRTACGRMLLILADRWRNSIAGSCSRSSSRMRMTT